MEPVFALLHSAPILAVLLAQRENISAFCDTLHRAHADLTEVVCILLVASCILYTGKTGSSSGYATVLTFAIDHMACWR